MDLGPRLRTSGDRLILGVPVWRRGVLGAIGVLMVVLLLYDGAISVLPLIVALTATVGALYTDDWVFDIASSTITHRTGVLPAVRTVSYPFELLARFRIEEIGIGGARRRYVKLIADLTDGTHHVVEIDRSRDGRLAADGERIAGAVGVVFQGGDGDQIEGEMRSE
jgi:hypothetical protein